MNRVCFLMMVLNSVFCLGQDFDSLNLSLFDKYNFRNNFHRNQITQNPANMFYYKNFSLSEIYAEYHKNEDKNFDIRKGNGWEGMRIKVESYQILTPQKHVVWGKAYYSKDIIKNVVLNETSDIENVYPYVSADSIGGNLQNETYFFEGGYAYKAGNNKIGIFCRYKAQQEYRNIDPRPKNLVSDLDIDLGYSREILTHYTLSTNIGFKNYTQSSDVKFASETGQPVLYQMLGLGNYSYLFTGKVFNTSYNGNSYRAGIQFLNSEKKNFFITADVEKFNNKKTEENTNGKLSMSKLDDKRYQISITKLFDWNNNSTLGINLNGSYKERTGTEFYYIDQGSYKERIDEKKQYTYKQSNLYFSLLYSKEFFKSSYSIIPFTNLRREKEKYIYPYSYQEFSDIFFGLNLGLNKSLSSKTNLFLSASFSWKKSINSKNNLYTTGLKESFQKQLMDYFELKTSDYFKTSFDTKVYFKISSLNLFINQSLEYIFYDQKPNYSHAISIGLVF